MIIAELDGAAAGFAVAGLEANQGFLRQIVVDPTAQRHGVGRALFDEVARRLAARGARRVRLNVKEDNAPAIALYRKMGMEVDYRSAALWMTHAARLQLPTDASFAAFAPDEDDDEAIEARFPRLRGQVAQLRAEAEPPLAVTDRGGNIVAAMRFAASYPGAYPFCATWATAARVLLDEIARVVPDAPRYGLVVENDEPLIGLLLHAGATMRFRMFQMEGPL
jgi:hypothetical protein